MKSKVKYIGIGASGPGEGKSTVSSMVAELCNYKLVHFGDALKKEVKNVFHEVNKLDGGIDYYIRKYSIDVNQACRLQYVFDLWAGQSFDLYDEETKNKWFREWLQFWGTDFRRFTDPDYWINQIDWSSNLVIGDLRFGGFSTGSEIKAINNRGGVSIYINAHKNKDKSKNHSSEMLDPDECNLQIKWSKTDDKKSYRGFCEICDFTNNKTPRYKLWKECLDRHICK